MIAERLQGVNASETLVISAKAKELKAQGVDVVSFTVGEPDFDTPTHIKQAAIEAIESGFTKYTAAEGIPELRRAIVERVKEDLGLDYEIKNVVVSNGSKQALYNFFQAVLNKGDQVLVPAPYWLSYPPMIKLAGGIPKIIQTTQKQNFKITPEQLKKAIRPKTKAIILNSPSNPTGAVYTKEELESLARILEEHDLWVLSDDAYSKLLYDGFTFYSIAKFSKNLFSKTIIFDTLSKTYAMTGWRVGYAVGSEEILKAMAIIQSQATSSINSISQKAALKALTSSQACVKAMVKEFEGRRNLALQELSKIKKIKCFVPQGAFYLFPDVSKYYGLKFRGKEITGSNDLATYLLDEAKVATIPGYVFGADKCIRLSYAASLDHIQKGIARIHKALEQLE